MSHTTQETCSTPGRPQPNPNTLIHFVLCQQTYHYKLRPTPLCQTRAGIRGLCRCGTATWTQCLCQHSGLACGSIWPAESSREGRRDTDQNICRIMRGLSSKVKASCSKMSDTYTFEVSAQNRQIRFLGNKVTKPLSRSKFILQRSDMATLPSFFSIL